MKHPHILIIAEDTVKIQTYSGILGRTYAFVYINWLKLRVWLVSSALRLFSRVTVLTADGYSDYLSVVDYAKHRDWYWHMIRRMTADFNSQLFATRLATYLVYNYFIYAEVYGRLLDEREPDRVIVMGNSYHEQIAAFICQKRQIPVTKFWPGSLTRWQQLVQRFLLNREYQIKVDNFMKQSRLTKSHPAKGAVLLSVDFYRHLKTLIPLYKQLEQRGEKPCLITDVPNLEPTLDSLYFHPAEVVYLAQFLPKGEKTGFNRQPANNPGPAQSLEDCLVGAGRLAAAPIIKHSLVLSRLYRSAAKNLFKQVKPKGVIAVSDVRFLELVLTETAGNFNTPSVLASPNTMLDLAQINPYRSADKVAVAGRYIKKQLMNIGLPAKKIYLTGDLVKENVSGRHHLLNKKRVVEILGIDPDKKIILVVSFRPTWMIPKKEKQAFIEMTLEAVNARKDLVTVIKPHPTEKRYRLLEELNQWGIKGAVVADNNQVSLLDLLHVAAVVVQTWSFTVFEAIMLNRPVISVNPFNKNYNNFLPIIRPGGAVEVTKLKELKKWLAILVNANHPLTQKQRRRARRASREFIHYSPGEGSGKVADLLLGK